MMRLLIHYERQHALEAYLAALLPGLQLQTENRHGPMHVLRLSGMSDAVIEETLARMETDVHRLAPDLTIRTSLAHLESLPERLEADPYLGPLCLWVGEISLTQGAFLLIGSAEQQMRALIRLRQAAPRLRFKLEVPDEWQPSEDDLHRLTAGTEGVSKEHLDDLYGLMGRPSRSCLQ